LLHVPLILSWVIFGGKARWWGSLSSLISLLSLAHWASNYVTAKEAISRNTSWKFKFFCFNPLSVASI
jgi:hypothetical protein